MRSVVRLLEAQSLNSGAKILFNVVVYHEQYGGKILFNSVLSGTYSNFKTITIHAISLYKCLQPELNMKHEEFFG